MAARCLAARLVATPDHSNATPPDSEGRSDVRKSFVVSIAAALIVLCSAPPGAVAQDQASSSGAPAGKTGRGAVSAVCNQDQASTLGGPAVDRSGCPRPVGPSGPVPRLSD